MNYKEQRESQINFLITQLDGKLISYECLYNEEKVKYKCNKCNNEYYYKFGFLYNKIKYNQFCSCHESETFDMLEAYSLEEFDKTIKEVNESKTLLNNHKNAFLYQESKQIMYLISKNRGASSYNINSKLVNVVCKNKHKFTHKIEDVIKGKWCPECESEENYYYLEEITTKK